MRLLTVKDVAERLNVSVTTVNRLVKTALKSVKIGKSRRVRESDLEEYIRSLG